MLTIAYIIMRSRHTRAPLTHCVSLCTASGCSIQDELFGAFEYLITLSDQRKTPYDRYHPCTGASNAAWLTVLVEGIGMSQVL